jgi:hypothetical protein
MNKMSDNHNKDHTIALSMKDSNLYFQISAALPLEQ